MTTRRTRFVLAGLSLLIAIQFIPIERSNPPLTAPLQAPKPLEEVLQRACYDCHSNETVWPWYSRLAPASWLLVHDVSEGREHLNFSRWDNYDSEKRAKLKKEIWEEVEEGEMPPLQYYPAHPEARLSEKDKNLIRTWSRGGA